MLFKGAEDRNVSAIEGPGDETKKSTKGRAANKLGPILYEMCEGKRLESKIYPKSEFSRLSKQQKSIVVKLNKQRRQNARGRSNNHRSHGGSSSVISSLRNDISSLGNAIVAGVTKIIKAPGDQSLVSPSALTPNNVTLIEPQVESGEVGEFIAQSRKRRRSH